MAIGLTVVAAAWGGESAVTQALTAIPRCRGGPGQQTGWHSPRQWGRPGLGSQCTAPSRQTQAVQVSGSQRAPSGQARPSPQHWAEAGRHSQDSSCLTLSCSSLFWGKEAEGKAGGAGSAPPHPTHPADLGGVKTEQGEKEIRLFQGTGGSPPESTQISHSSQDSEFGQAPRGRTGPPDLSFGQKQTQSPLPIKDLHPSRIFSDDALCMLGALYCWPNTRKHEHLN